MKLRRLQHTHRDYDGKMLRRYRDLFEGGESFCKRVANYLPKHPQEPGPVYMQRLEVARAEYVNYSAPIANYFASWLMTSELVIKHEPPEVDEFYQDFQEDVDGLGCELTHFLRCAFVDALIDGCAFWRVEFPSGEEREDKTLAEWQLAGEGEGRLVRIPSENIIDWREDGHGCVWIVEHERDQYLAEPGDKDETVCERWTVWRRDGEHCRYEIEYPSKRPPNPDTDVPEVDLPKTWGNIEGSPIVELTLPDEMWLMNLIAGPQIANWRKRVGLSWAIDRSAYAMPVFQVKNRRRPPVMGAGYYLIQGVGEDCKYLAPPADTFSVMKEYIDGIKDEIHRVVHQMARGVDNQQAAAVGRSGQSKEADDRATEIVLSGYGAHVRDAVQCTLDLLAEGRGDDIEFQIEGLSSYHVTDSQSLINEATAAQGINVPSETHRKEVAKRVSAAQLPDVDEHVRKQINDEIDASAPALAPGIPGAVDAAPGTGAPIPPNGAPPKPGDPKEGGNAGNGVQGVPGSSGDPPVGPGGSNASLVASGAPSAAPSAPGGGDIASQVHAQLSEDFAPEAVEWVKQAQWSGPQDVPLAQIDFSNSATWAASDNPGKVDKFTKKIGAGKKKPVVLVDGGAGKYRVVDGHHRVLAYQKLGQPVPAYIAKVSSDALQKALEMHASQKKQPSGAKPDGAPPASK